MFSFKNKIFITYAAAFFIFALLIFPLISRKVHQTVMEAMDHRAAEIIEKIKDAPDDEALVQLLKDQKNVIFFRVGIITNESKLLYDTHTRKLLGTNFNQNAITHIPEVDEAVKNGTGYNEEFSALMGQKFAYFAKSFDFHHKIYVLRTAFPYQYVTELTHDFIMGFILLFSAILLLFSFLTWLIINNLTKPIHKITNAVNAYQEGQLSTLPTISISPKSPKDEFNKLASTINSLSSKVKNHIDSLTYEKNEKEAILESLVEGVIAIDASKTIQYANQTAVKFLQIPAEQLIGKPIDSINQGKCEALLRECQEKNEALLDAIELEMNGKKMYLDVVASPKKENGGAILVLQDKTPHYQLVEMQRDFIANASHELKTPITIIQGFAETLHDHPELPKETQNEITDKIVKSCKRMTSLITDFLSLANIDKIPLHKIVECDLPTLVESCHNQLLEIFPDAIVEIEKPENREVTLLADYDLLELALINLLINAGKYSERPAHITVSIDRSLTDVVLKVKDRGIGIPKADQEFIFERFYRVDKARSLKMGGSGLGLSIVKTIVNKHGGNITLESEEGKGTTFTILLPIRK